MKEEKPHRFRDVEQCVDAIVARVGKRIVFGMPLALGKPNHLANALYRRAKADPEIRLTIMTALSLEKPSGSSDLERRLVGPMADRIWEGFVEFDYMKDLRSGDLPANVDIREFFTKAGGYLNVPHAQQNYISSNYTHAIRDLIDNGMNVVGNLIAKRTLGSDTRYSMSCNADLMLEGLRRVAEERKVGREILVVGQVNTELPFMYGDAVVAPDVYDMVLDDPAYDFSLFSVPKPSVATPDHLIGIQVSTLIRDGGTLQIGIGSLGDAIASGLILRHHHNTAYRNLVSELGIEETHGALLARVGGLGPFDQGLYGATEMLVDAFIELYKAGILKRRVYDDPGIQALVNDGVIGEEVTPETLDALLANNVIAPCLDAEAFHFLQHFGVLSDNLTFAGDHIQNGSRTFGVDLGDAANRRAIEDHALGRHLKNGAVCHGAFFIGPKGFYRDLREMSETERRQFPMTGVEVVNQLYGNESLKRLQRRQARFVNAGMMVTLLGEIVSDTLANGQVVSGVGGQYNFVAMAHALEDGRLIMMVRSTRCKAGRPVSNIVFNYGHVTIPRHLRDIVVTEYGIADLRGKTDSEVICALINVADSRFQAELLDQAKKAGKVPGDYRIPEAFCHNTPERLEKLLAPYRDQGHFKAFPFGTDLTHEEIVLARALRKLRQKAATHKARVAAGVAGRLLKSTPSAHRPYLERMGLSAPASFRERLMKATVSYALSSD